VNRQYIPLQIDKDVKPLLKNYSKEREKLRDVSIIASSFGNKPYAPPGGV
jgi:hypothetical protein